MRSLLIMENPYQHAPEVSIVRIDTCTAHNRNQQEEQREGPQYDGKFAHGVRRP